MSDLGRQEEKGPSDATMKKIQCGQDLSVPCGEPDRSGQAGFSGAKGLH